MTVRHWASKYFELPSYFEKSTADLLPSILSVRLLSSCQREVVAVEIHLLTRARMAFYRICFCRNAFTTIRYEPHFPGRLDPNTVGQIFFLKNHSTEL